MTPKAYMAFWVVWGVAMIVAARFILVQPVLAALARLYVLPLK